MATTFDRYTMDPADEMLAEGGRPSPVRFSADGFEDCAREWDPCPCHGDRRCRLGQLVRFAKTSAEHAAWLRGERETPLGPELLRMSGCGKEWELRLKAEASSRSAREMWAEAWPLVMVCARDERSRLYDRRVAAEEARR